MPSALASRGLVIETGRPSTRICPPSGGWAPDRARMRVDLPAPLPPTSPTTSPARRSTVTSHTAWTPPNATLMLRISTSGGDPSFGGLGVVAVSVIDPVLWLRRPATEQRVKPHGRDEHGSDHDVLDRRVHAQDDHAGAERLHDHGAEHCAGNRSDPARKGRATDDSRRDRVQLALDPRAGHAGVEPGRLDGARDRAERTHEHVRQHDRAARVDPAELRGLRVAADREDVSPEPAAGGD